MSRNTSLHRQSRCKVPARKVQCSTNDQVWDLCDGLRSNESHPVVGFGLGEATRISMFTCHLGFDHPHLLLSGLKDVTAMQKEWLHLINTARGNKNKVEDSKESQLEGESATSDLPKCETTEESGENMQEEFVPHVVLITD
jgi:hypothetical protein